MADFLGLPVGVLPGLREIEAGIFEGTPEIIGGTATTLFVLPCMFGFRDVRIPGSIDGNEFDARTNGAVQTIYDTGVPDAVAFSHFGTIAFWTMTNADNADPLLLITHPIDNTSYVVVSGSPEEGWTVVDWDGRSGLS